MYNYIKKSLYMTKSVLPQSPLSRSMSTSSLIDRS